MVASGVIERPSSWPLMRPSSVGSEAPGKKGGRRKKDVSRGQHVGALSMKL